MVIHLYNTPPDTRQLLPRRFERKYYVSPPNTDMSYALIRQICLADKEYPSEQINSLYFDTADLDQYERSSSGDFRKDKVRIRWYGCETTLSGIQTAFIELKSREGFSGMKQRLKLSVPADNLTLDNLSRGIVPKSMLMATLARFGFFLTEPLQPIIKISYWRYRFCEIMTGQRVSLDCHIRSTMIIPGFGNGEKDLELPGAVIEIKGNIIELPKTLQQARILNIDWTRFSKYSACIDGHNEQLGLVGRLSPSGRIISL
jgi:hypothetical protein